MVIDSNFLQDISAIAARKQLQTVGASSKPRPQRETPTSLQTEERFGGSIPDLGLAIHALPKWLDSPDSGEDVVTNDGNMSDTSSYPEGDDFGGVASTYSYIPEHIPSLSTDLIETGHVLGGQRMYRGRRFI